MRIIFIDGKMLAFPVSVDRSSPPITLMSPVDWSFCNIWKRGKQSSFKTCMCSSY